MRPIRSALNRIHHPAILAAGLVLAVAIPVEMGVYSSQNLLSWSTIRISLLVAVLCAMLGAAPVWAACLLFAVSGYALLWLFSPLTTIMIAALTSIAVLSFVKPRLGAASALAALAALAANNMQNNLTSSNIVGMIIMCLCPLSLGFSLNLLFAQRQATATLRQRLDREHTARHLHDTISNDLAYMILRIDQASRSDCPADREQYQRQLTDLRAIAETALDHTHQVIRQLERTDKPDDRSRIVKTNNDDKTDRKSNSSVNGLTASFNRNDVALAASDSKVTTSSGRSTIHWRTTSSTFSKDCSTNCTRTSPSTPPRTNGTPSRSPSTGGTSSFRQATY